MMPQEKYRCSFWKKLISPSHKSSIISSYAKSRRNAHPPALPATRREQRTTNNEQRTTQYFRARLRLTMAISAQQPPLLLGGADARRWIRRRLLSSRMPSPDNERRWFRPGAAGTVAITSAPFSLISATRPARPSPSFLDVLNKISMGVSGELVAEDAAPTGVADRQGRVGTGS